VEKLTYTDAATLLKEAAQDNRQSYQRIVELEKVSSSYDRLTHAIKIAKAVDPRFMEGSDPLDYAIKLAQSGEDLHVLERAVDLRANDPKLASVGSHNVTAQDENYSPSAQQTGASADMNEWLMSSSMEGAGFIS